MAKQTTLGCDGKTDGATCAETVVMEPIGVIPVGWAQINVAVRVGAVETISEELYLCPVHWAAFVAALGATVSV